MGDIRKEGESSKVTAGEVAVTVDTTT